jgi:uncharacterized membrane protein YidH (DUF202 family)
VTGHQQPDVREGGLQAERTNLAWQRTALAFLALGLAVLGVGWPVVGGWSLVPSALVVPGAVTILFAARRRYDRALAAGPVRLPDGRLPLLAVVLAGTLGLVAALLVAAPVLPRG